jgi:heme oxygenase
MTSTSSTSATDARFSEVVRDATFADHERAAMSEFMSALFGERLPIAGYTEMVVQHLFAYEVLEQAGDELRDHPVAGAFVTEDLRRVPSIEADLLVLRGEDWSSAITPSAATAAYCDRMRQVCVSSPECFVAHHYTRYMGDLSGGQMIGRIARSTYGLAEGAGAAFYEFPGIADLGAFKDDYRRRLDVAEWTPDERERLLAEVAIAYRHNTEVFDELDRDLRAGAFG